MAKSRTPHRYKLDTTNCKITTHTATSKPIPDLCSQTNILNTIEAPIMTESNITLISSDKFMKHYQDNKPNDCYIFSSKRFQNNNIRWPILLIQLHKILCKNGNCQKYLIPATNVQECLKTRNLEIIEEMLITKTNMNAFIECNGKIVNYTLKSTANILLLPNCHYTFASENSTFTLPKLTVRHDILKNPLDIEEISLITKIKDENDYKSNSQSSKSSTQNKTDIQLTSFYILITMISTTMLLSLGLIGLIIYIKFKVGKFSLT